jgi:F-type H+-transporting ATPase subunit delta
MQIGIKENNLDGLYQELGSVIELVASESHSDLERLCMHPLIPPSRKAAVLDEILRTAGAGETIRRFFMVVAKAARLNLIYKLGDAFFDIYNHHMGILMGEVASAQPLTDSQKSELEGVFEKRTGKKINLEQSHDPSLLGGLRVKIGSTVYDASLRGSLDRLKGQLLSV